MWREREREDNILKDPAPSVEGLPVSVGSVLLVNVLHSTVRAGKTRIAKAPSGLFGVELRAMFWAVR